MDYNEIKAILESCLEKEDEEFAQPTQQEWDELTNITNCNFSKEFKEFIRLMSVWAFPGDIYNVALHNNNGNDTIAEVYCHELENGEWNKNMIPFYGIGNGDYFCLNSSDSKVYYYYEDLGKFEVYCDDFNMWISGLPEFLR